MNNLTTIEGMQARYEKVYALACQMLLAIILLSLWCLFLAYSNCKLEEKCRELEKQIILIANTDE